MATTLSGGIPDHFSEPFQNTNQNKSSLGPFITQVFFCKKSAPGRSPIWHRISLSSPDSAAHD
jgi:hypothetical protein